MDAQSQPVQYNYLFDSLGQLVDAQIPGIEGGITFSYHDDLLGRISQTTEGLDQQVNYEYNPTYPVRLTSARQDYSYDASGRTTWRGDLHFDYDEWGRVGNVQRGILGENYTYFYDNDGRRIAKIVEDNRGETEVTRFIWDDLGRLIAEQDEQGMTTREYIWLGDTPIAMLDFVSKMSGAVCDFSAASGKMTVRSFARHINAWQLNILVAFLPVLFVVGLLKRKQEKGFIRLGVLAAMFAMGVVVSSPMLSTSLRAKAYRAAKYQVTEIVPYILHTDHLGAVVAATREDGAVAWSARYYPFGELYDEQTDPDGDGEEVFVNLRRPGQYHDRETGLYYNVQRYYDPEIGRYVRPDPVVNPALPGNSYNYALNNPILAFDPDGEELITILVLGGAAIGMAAAGAWFTNKAMDKALAYGDPELANDVLDSHKKNTYCSFGALGGGIVLAEFGPAIASTIASSRLLNDITGGWNN